MKAAFPGIKRSIRRRFKKKLIYRRLPILQWLPSYKFQYAIGDVVAGITIGLMLIPQALACANIAGLPPQYGLRSSFAGCIVYIFFGSWKDISMGPTVTAAFLTYQAINGNGIESAIILSFLSGCIAVLMGLFNLGFLVNFISDPVSTGFTSAAAVLIVAQQARDILGITASGSTFVQLLINIVPQIKNTNIWDTMMGLSCIIMLILMRILIAVKVKHKNKIKDHSEISSSDKKNETVDKILLLLGNCSNVVVVILCGMIGYWTTVTQKESPLTLLGDIPYSGLTIQVPSFTYIQNNQTITFIETVSSFGSNLVVVPLLLLLEDIATCRLLAKGKPFDATQEMIAVGLSNIMNSFVQGFPVTGALARSSVNRKSGVCTPLGGLYTSILVILALLFLTPYFYYIPKCCLASIIIAAIVFMVDVKKVKPMWRTKKIDLCLSLMTFVACLILALELGILVGIAINLLIVLYYASRPNVSIEKNVSPHGVSYLQITPDRFLIFSSAEYIQNIVTKHSIRENLPVVIDCSHIHVFDYTTASIIKILTFSFYERKQLLLFCNLDSSIIKMVKALSPKEFTVLVSKQDTEKFLDSLNQQ